MGISKSFVQLGLFAIMTVASTHCEGASIDGYSKTTAFLYHEEKVEQVEIIDGQEISRSSFTRNSFLTGFFVAAGSGDKTKGFLVTAKHGIRSFKPHDLVIISNDNDRPLRLKFSDLTGKSSHLDWISHEMSDVAILPLSMNSSLSASLAGRFLPIELLAEKPHAPDKEAPLAILGFPLGIGVGEFASPILRNTRAASGIVNIGPVALFVLQDPSVGGFSGSPVFKPSHYNTEMRTTLGPVDYEVIGIVSGTISDDTGGKFAAITPVYFLAELLKRQVP